MAIPYTGVSLSILNFSASPFHTFIARDHWDRSLRRLPRMLPHQMLRLSDSELDQWPATRFRVSIGPFTKSIPQLSAWRRERNILLTCKNVRLLPPKSSWVMH